MADVCRILKGSGSRRFLGYNLNTILVPNIEYLKSCGVCPLQIASQVCRNPSKYVVNPDKFKGTVQRVDEMGVDRKSKIFVKAVSMMSSFSRDNWELKLQVLRDRELGFSEQDILVASRRAPQAFGTSNRKLKEATQLLLSVEDISFIANNSMLLTYSVEKRLKPRLRVFNALMSKSLLEKKPSLSGLLKLSDAQFIEKYVSPYSSEVGSLYVASQGS